MENTRFSIGVFHSYLKKFDYKRTIITTKTSKLKKAKFNFIKMGRRSTKKGKNQLIIFEPEFVLSRFDKGNLWQVWKCTRCFTLIFVYLSPIFPTLPEDSRLLLLPSPGLPSPGSLSGSAEAAKVSILLFNRSITKTWKVSTFWSKAKMSLSYPVITQSITFSFSVIFPKWLNWSR